jgi:hypothetical protein
MVTSFGSDPRGLGAPWMIGGNGPAVRMHPRNHFHFWMHGEQELMHRTPTRGLSPMPLFRRLRMEPKNCEEASRNLAMGLVSAVAHMTRHVCLY